MTRWNEIPLRRRRVGAVAGAATLVAALAWGTAGCSDDDQPKDLRDAASSVQSALDRAGDEFNDFRNGVDAAGDVKPGPVRIDSDGRATTEVTATNTGDSSADFLVQVEFRKPNNDIADTVVLNIKNVEPGKTGTGTARSNFDLNDNVTASVPRALRH
ncbi:hypothetical protein LO772_04640 [Yinghuangia sp. ASG 101]|uniref:hypothetical protein n=1 Tax=Yinghuangia sp. ASG 101 TaxID=2896848 RepID=UPI001E62ACB6|nr:hypothetical protein [Yinghuangia sp. ASG 101]UGQ12911.1 hypothetical protein LO772_04640 [Yinghuangia sp. ASG 101]